MAELQKPPTATPFQAIIPLQSRLWLGLRNDYKTITGLYTVKDVPDNKHKKDIETL